MTFIKQADPMLRTKKYNFPTRISVTIQTDQIQLNIMKN